MDPKSQAAVDDFAARVRRRIPNARIWAFGSRVHGTHHEFSDLDLCVVAPDLDDAADRYVMDCAWDAGFAHDVVITTVTTPAMSSRKAPAPRARWSRPSCTKA
jgi:DNA polymerase sigma